MISDTKKYEISEVINILVLTGRAQEVEREFDVGFEPSISFNVILTFYFSQIKDVT